MSRPFIWMFWKVGADDGLAASAVRDLNGSHFRCDLEQFRVTPPTSIFSFPRSRVSAVDRLMSETVSVLKLASSTVTT